MSYGNTISGGQNYNINFNFNFGGANGVSGGGGDLLNRLSDILSPRTTSYSDIFSNYFRGGNSDNASFPAPVETPSLWDGGQPSGSLTVEGDKIKTAGGYTIEQLGQFEWKVTGPDGKETRVWGDPHVAEGDGGKWDFKRNSTFVLGDGTKINVTTAPYGSNGMTVTSKLEVISGNDRVVVSDIDKGKGKVGTVTQDGYAHANSFQGDVFVQGQETDDWSFTGKEITGSKNGGESFELGGQLNPPTNGGNVRAENPFEEMINRWFGNNSWLSNALRNIFQNMFTPTNNIGSNPYTGNTRPQWENFGGGYDRGIHQNNLTQSFRDLSNAFGILANFSELNDRVSIMRNRIYA